MVLVLVGGGIPVCVLPAVRLLLAMSWELDRVGQAAYLYRVRPHESCIWAGDRMQGEGEGEGARGPDEAGLSRAEDEAVCEGELWMCMYPIELMWTTDGPGKAEIVMPDRARVGHYHSTDVERYFAAVLG